MMKWLFKILSKSTPWLIYDKLMVFVKVTDWSSNKSNKNNKNKNESKRNLHCKKCKSWVPIENTMEMICSGLTINANGYCHRLNSWIDSYDYCAYFSEKHSPDDSNCKLKKGDE